MSQMHYAYLYLFYPIPRHLARGFGKKDDENDKKCGIEALAERSPPRRLVHPLHRLRVLGLSTGALADDDRLEAALCQQLHQGLGLRAELGLSKGPVTPRCLSG